ncbi:MAG: Gfo/Idh/MocA family protein [Candidatus Hodarchaeales archaeon]|jgi:predicted dehydrogenase
MKPKNSSINPITAVLIGAGNRGLDTYGTLALQNPDLMKFVAVAEPITQRRKKFAKNHDINPNMCFENWESLFRMNKIAQAAVICTQDQYHTEPVLKALRIGYDVLLEKPMANTLEDCQSLVQTAESSGKILQICHVLRYTPFYSKIKEIIDSGKIGKVTNISMRENVSYFHYAHSFIRGNWANREKSSPMILAKCCHDLDLLYWFVGSKPVNLSSFGSMTHFGKKNTPDKNVPERCTDGCSVSDSCLYYAPRIYVTIHPFLHIIQKKGNRINRGIASLALKHPKVFSRLKKLIPRFRAIDNYSGWPINVITDNYTIEGKIKALKEGPYGRCVYKVDDHNVVDHQVVSIEFENNTTGTLAMHGHSHEEGRTIRLDGTKGTLIGEFLFSGESLRHYDSLTGEIEEINISHDSSGHGGGDLGILRAFVEQIRSPSSSTTKTNFTSAQSSLESHLMAFAADKARLEKRLVSMDEFRNN